MSKRPNHATFQIRKPNAVLNSVKGWFNGDTQLTNSNYYARLPIQEEWALRQKRFREFDLSSALKSQTIFTRADHVRRF